MKPCRCTLEVKGATKTLSSHFTTAVHTNLSKSERGERRKAAASRQLLMVCRQLSIPNKHSCGRSYDTVRCRKDLVLRGTLPQRTQSTE